MRRSNTIVRPDDKVDVADRKAVVTRFNRPFIYLEESSAKNDITDAILQRLNAELVVLSGCRTALGKELQGEGLIGLTRGFMYAGAPRVVASLWNVDDLATAELMKLFYQGMLKDGLPAGASLRAAQLELSRQKRWASPYYWAGFVLHGEWK